MYDPLGKLVALRVTIETLPTHTSVALVDKPVKSGLGVTVTNTDAELAELHAPL